MKKLILTLTALSALAGCYKPEPARTIGTQNGKALYQTTCDINQSAVGGKALFGPNKGKRVTAYYGCEPQARETCPSGFTVTDMTQGIPERHTQTFQNGAYTTRQTFYIRKTTIQYTCNGA